MLENKEDAANPTEPSAPPGLGGARRSRSIFAYYLPVIVVAVLSIAAFTYLASWLSARAANQRQLDLTRSLAAAVQGLAATEVQDKFALLRMLQGDPLLRQVPEDPAGVKRVARRLERRLSGAVEVVLVPANWTDEQVLAAVGGSFAAADKFQQVLERKGRSPAEVIRDPHGRHRIVLAGGVPGRERIQAVLFLEFPLEPMQKRIQALGLKEAKVRLEQSFAGGRMPLAESGGDPGKSADGILPVPDTLWQVRYQAPATAGMSWSELATLLGAGALLMLGVTFLGYSLLARALHKDMELMVALVDATLKQQGAPRVRPFLKEAGPAMDLLIRYAQAAWDKTRISRSVSGANSAPGGMQVEEVPASVAGVEETTAEMAAMSEERLPLSLFHASVIRGRSEEELDEEVAHALGRGIGSMVLDAGERMVLLARDHRAHSDAYASALASGVLASGCDVLDLGEAPAPLLNYALRNGPATSGVMVTGGHSQPGYNGFKVYLDTRPIQEDGYLELRQRLIDGQYRRGAGRLDRHDFTQEYIDRVTSDVQLVEPLRVAVDGGNGVAGTLAVRLLETLGCEVVPLYCDPDPEFPNHPPDPSNPAHFQSLISEVRTRGLHLGVALDGDGDALGLVDEQGRMVAPDRLLMLLAEDIIRRNPGADVIYDVGCSARLPEFILANGGRPILWKSGHARIQAHLAESGALLAGESSGHLYLADRWCGCDDALYALVRLLEIFSLGDMPVSGLMQSLDTGLVATPLLRMPMAPGMAEQVVARLATRESFDGADVVNLDGLRLEYASAWALVRPSHTEPALVFRFEGQDEAALQEAQERLRGYLAEWIPDAHLPF